MRFDIRLRMLVLILLMALPLAGIGLWNARSLGLAMENRLYQNSSYILDQILQSYIDPINTISGILQTLAVSVDTHSPSRCSHQLEEATRVNSILSAAVLIRVSDRKSICSSNAKSATSIPDDVDMQAAVRDRTIKITGYAQGRISKRQILRVIVPVLAEDGQVTSLLVGGLDLKVVNAEISRGLHLTDQMIMVFDSNGNIVGFMPKEEGIIGQNIANHELYRQAISGDTTQGFTLAPLLGPESSKKIWAITRKIPHSVANGLYLALLTPADSFYASLREGQHDTIAMTLILLVITVGLTMLLVNNSILRPVDHLAKVTNRFAHGDLDARAGNQYANTELGGLMRDFDSMAEVVEQNIRERERLAQMKAQFTSTVSHELRTPLTAIKGSLALINSGVMGDVDAEVRDMTVVAEDSCERLIRLINDLLDMDKLTAGKVKIHWQDVPLQDVLATLKRDIAGYAKQYNVLVESDDHTEKDTILRTDSDRLLQILMNLVSNAIKYSPAEQAVVVSLSHPTPDRVRIAVQDHGPGIPAEFRPRIFQSFTQADSSDRRVKGGTGLGLAISRNLTELLGGEIGFDSEEGKGATFYIVLPLIPSLSEGSTSS